MGEHQSVQRCRCSMAEKTVRLNKNMRKKLFSVCLNYFYSLIKQNGFDVNSTINSLRVNLRVNNFSFHILEPCRLQGARSRQLVSNMCRAVQTSKWFADAIWFCRSFSLNHWRECLELHFGTPLTCGWKSCLKIVQLRAIDSTCYYHLLVHTLAHLRIPMYSHMKPTIAPSTYLWRVAPLAMQNAHCIKPIRRKK